MSYGIDRPEGLLGALLAFEGIRDSAVILNGPTGCKYYPASASESSYRNRPEGPQTYNPYRYQREFFFSQPRIPCTYMDGNDYIMGTRGRLDDAVEALRPFHPNLIGIVNSPGASLIGEDLSLSAAPDVPIVRMESPDYSVSMGTGFQDAVISILETLKPLPSERKKGVNLIGLSIWHLNWTDSIGDLKDLLELCGIEINCVAGAGWSVEDIRNSSGAELNVIVHEEFGLRIAEWYQTECGTPYVSIEEAPIGFDALERFVISVAEALHKDPSKALTAIKNARTKAADILSYLELSRRPARGRTFSVAADGSLVYTITRFLYGYLGMIPVALDTGMDATWNERIQSFLSEKRLTVGRDVFDTPCDVLIGDGNLIASAVRRGIATGGAAVASPGTFNIDLEERPVLGLRGTVRLLDSVLNALEGTGRTN